MSALQLVYPTEQVVSVPVPRALSRIKQWRMTFSSDELLSLPTARSPTNAIYVRASQVGRWVGGWVVASAAYE